MFKYFKELLETIKLIEKHLSKIASCVSVERRGANKMNVCQRPDKY